MFDGLLGVKSLNLEKKTREKNSVRDEILGLKTF